MNAIFLRIERLRVDLEHQISYRSLRLIVLYKIRFFKNQNDPRNMSLRSINLKIGRLSGNECAIFEPRTATGRLRTSNKVPFAPSHRPLQDSMVKNQNDLRTMSLWLKKPKILSIIW